jgi:hypothetical protein
MERKKSVESGYCVCRCVCRFLVSVMSYSCGGINRLMRLWPPTGPGVFSVTGARRLRGGYQERRAYGISNE